MKNREATTKIKSSIFRSVVFGNEAIEYHLEDEDEHIDDRLRVDDDPDVRELNESMSRALAGFAGKVEDATREPRHPADAFNRGDRARPRRQYPAGGYTMLLEDEDSIDVEDRENFLRPEDSGLARPARSNFPEPSNRVGGLIRKRGNGLFTDIVFGQGQ